jgi:hypothetical protein
MRSHSVLAGACAVLAALAIAASAMLVYARVDLLDADRFADRAVGALHDSRVREAVADRVVTAAIDHGNRDLLTARPLLLSAVQTVILTAPFQELLRAAVRQAHRVLFSASNPTISIDIRQTAQLLEPAIRSVDPQLADDLPRRLNVPLATLDKRAFAADTIQAADAVRALALVLPFVAALLLTGSVLLASNRGFALRHAPLAVAAGMGLVLLLLALAEPNAARAVRGLTHGQADAAVDGVWNALVGDLRDWALGVGLSGLAVVVLLSPYTRRLAGPARDLARALVARPRGRFAAAGRGIALGAVGLLIVLAPSGTLRVVGLALGGLLIAAGTAEVIAAVVGRAREPRAGAGPVAEAEGALTDARATWERNRRVRMGVTAAAALAVAGVATAVALSVSGGGERSAARRPITVCNGSAALCSRRLNEVVFPGTHNSMSAADRPGWLFANQRHDIPTQLHDGIRLLLIDTHWAVRTPDGRVRTDLPAEGSKRNRAAKALGSQRAVRIAEQIAGRVGLGSLKGRREVWLCHTLCELGATSMQETLRDLRRFLDAHPGDLVVLFLEPSVPAWATEREFRDAGLIPRIAALRRDRPMPTLGSLLRAHRQLVVLGEHDTQGVPWYLDGFSFIQDTPLGKASGTSCARFRGSPSSPIFMINGWADRFPPLPSADARFETRAALLQRVRRCTRVRGVRPSFVAVDHYDLGAIVRVARELNRRPPPPATPPTPAAAPPR